MNIWGISSKLRRLLAWLAGLALAACTIAPQLPPAAGLGPERGGNVIVHVWRPISNSPTQPWLGPRTRLFTYVLVGDIGSGNSDEAGRRAEAALEVLIQKVQDGQELTDSKSGLTPLLLQQANQFCIPATSQNLSKITRSEYSYSLAAGYLNLFRVALSENENLTESLAGVGPFLIATRKPVGELWSTDAQGKQVIDTTSPILVMDMSGRQPDAIPEYVNAFKSAVRDDVALTSEIKPLRPAIASFLLTLNEAIPMVAEAYAGTRKQFE
ncbi:hypothetical protein FSB08_17025 [Paraburkholderia sp. JPY432]|uniref:hypothetical protein n=1 Tax=Paraburkholderia youngii TaxID=2782701 RepID=UPI00159509AF|nr:hypothetical protein [Paraburkholderia youngii]NVH74207.1 hypothetical protein [Paraburkholderia youngii]